MPACGIDRDNDVSAHPGQDATMPCGDTGTINVQMVSLEAGKIVREGRRFPHCLAMAS